MVAYHDHQELLRRTYQQRSVKTERLRTYGESCLLAGHLDHLAFRKAGEAYHPDDLRRP
jgi:hypothetical protein